jgi:hypothetical protein
MYGPPLLYPAEALKRLKFYTIPKSPRLRETVARLAQELEGFVYSDEELKTKQAFREADHPRGQPDNPGQFVEKDNHAAQPDTKASNAALSGQDGKPSRGGNTPPRFIDRDKTDYSKLDYENAVKTEYAYLQERTNKTGNECMSIMNDKKEILGTWEGEKDYINNDAVMKRMLKINKPNSLSLLHTHTKELSFSDVDIETLCDNISIKDVGAVTPKGTEYYISIGDGVRPAKDEVKKKARQVSKTLLNLDKYKNMEQNDERWTSFFVDRNAILQRIYDWIVR